MPFRRRRPEAAVPLPPTHTTTVAGHPVEVHTPPAMVDAVLDGWIRQHAVAVRPVDRSRPGVTVPRRARALMEVFDERSHQPVPTGDPLFDGRYRVDGPSGLALPTVLTAPLRALLLEHDVVFLLAHSNGAWVGVAHDGPDGRDAAEAVALQVLTLLVPT